MEWGTGFLKHELHGTCGCGGDRGHGGSWDGDQLSSDQGSKSIACGEGEKQAESYRGESKMAYPRNSRLGKDISGMTTGLIVSLVRSAPYTHALFWVLSLDVLIYRKYLVLCSFLN